MHANVALGRRSDSSRLRRTYGAVRYFALVGALLLVAACDDAGNRTAADYIASGVEHLEAGRAPAAAIQLKNAVQQDPENPTPRVLLARAYFAIEALSEAEKELEQAIRLGETSESVRALLADTKARLGKHEEILQFTETYGDFQDPRYRSDFLVVKARTYNARGVQPTAEALLSRVLETGPHAGALTVQALQALADGRHDEGLALLNRALASDPDNVDALLAKGQLLFSLGTVEESREILAHAYELRPHALRVQISLANAEAATGNFEQARQLLERIERVAQNNSNALYLKAFLALADGEYDEARSISDELLGNFPRHAPALAISGRSNLILNNLEISREHFNKYLAERPDDANIAFLLAWVSIELEDNRVAIEALETFRDATDSVDAWQLEQGVDLAMRAGDVRLAADLVYGLLLSFPESTRAQRIVRGTQVQRARETRPSRELAARVDVRPTVIGYDDAAQSSEPLFAQVLNVAAGLGPRYVLSAYYVTVAADRYVQQGHSSLEEDALQEAHKSFERALSVEPDNIDALVALAYLQETGGETEQAVRTLEQAIAAHPDNALVRKIHDELASQAPDRLTRLKALVVARQGTVEIDQALAATNTAQSSNSDSSPGQPDADGAERDPRRLHLEILAYLNQRNIEAATRTAEEFRRRFPNDPVAYNDTALVYLAQSKFTDAEASYRKSIEIDPDNPTAVLSLTQLLKNRGEFDGARRLLSRYLERNPEYGKARVEYAEILATLGEWDSAEEVLLGTVRLYPEELEPRVVAARFLIARGRSDEALDLLAAAEDTFSSNETYLDSLAVAQRANADFLGAAQTYDRLATLSAEPAVHLHAAAQSYLDADDKPAAMERLRSALSASEAYFPARALLAELLLAEGDTAAARTQLETFDEQRPNTAMGAELWAAYFTALDDLEQAAVHLERAIDLESSSERARKLSLLQQNLGRTTEAVVTLERRLAVARDDVRTRRQAYLLYLLNGDYRPALGHIQTLRQNGAVTRDLLNNEAFALMKLGELDAAEERGRQALESYPSDPAIGYTLGVILLEMNRPEEALAKLLASNETFEADPNFRYHLARALAANGREDEATTLLEEIVNAGTSFTERDEAEKLLKTLRGGQD